MQTAIEINPRTKFADEVRIGGYSQGIFRHEHVEVAGYVMRDGVEFLKGGTVTSRPYSIPELVAGYICKRLGGSYPKNKIVVRDCIIAENAIRAGAA